MNSLAVKAGRDFLNANCPDWRSKINFDTLDLRFWSNCILGQVFGIKNLPKGYGSLPGSLEANGFFARNAEDNAMLIQLWREVVNAE